MILSIKNMVCNRCIMAVEQVLTRNGISTFDVSMGKAVISDDMLSSRLIDKLKNELLEIGFEVLDDKRSKTIDQIKTIIIKRIHHQELDHQQFNWSDIISTELNLEYKSLSQLFSSFEGVTIEHFIILQKIERIKELLIYNELSISEISWKLGYSSVAYMSNQFYKTTGMRPKEFKSLGFQERKPLDKI